MSRFDACLAFVLKMEGGFVNDPADRGGATNKGITQATYDAYHDKMSTPHQSVKFITDDEVRAIYGKQYWLEGLLSTLDLVVFDSAVQHGFGRACKWLQRCLGVTEDGSVGDESRRALLFANQNELVSKYLDIREAFYAKIIANDPSQEKYKRGWANRVDLLKKEISKT